MRSRSPGQRSSPTSLIQHGRALAPRPGLVVGAFVASDYDYFKGVNKIEEVAEAALAVVLWPLVLLDVSMHF
jgi:hypothetical protein